VAALAGEEVEAELGEAIRDEENPIYMEMIAEVEPFEGAGALLGELKERGHPLVLASSAKSKEVDHYLDLLDARALVDAWTTAADVEATKPNPDLVEAALERAGTRDAVLVGDSVWDCVAADRAGIAAVGVLTGGYSREELAGSGAAAVFDSIEELRGDLGALDAAAGGRRGSA
jgi:HAD superfamily hydrolase (TIGR01549 family)